MVIKVYTVRSYSSSVKLCQVVTYTRMSLMSECRLRPDVISRSRPDVISNQDFEKSLPLDKTCRICLLECYYEGPW